jgi:hypothetical protein
VVLVKPDIGQRVVNGWHEATASLQLTPHPEEDIGLLADIQATEASAGWIGITIAGARDA